MEFLRPLCLLLLAGPLLAEEAPRQDPRYPFRTDFANAELPWNQPKPGEFPPHHSDRRMGGALVSVDYYLRKGTFRALHAVSASRISRGQAPTSALTCRAGSPCVPFLSR